MPKRNREKCFEDNYPEASTVPPAFIVQYTNVPGLSIVGPFTKEISDRLAEFVKGYPNTIDSVSGYWELIQKPNLKLIANQAISANNQTMLTTISFSHDASDDDIKEAIIDLIKFSKDYSSGDVIVQTSGINALLQEMQDATKGNFALIDGTVLPICLLLLGYKVQSYRHIFLALINLGCTLLLAFAILVPISDPIAINPFAPSIMMSLGIAVCFDYTLFMITRFREELLENKGKEDAVFGMLAASGHVVVLSGSTLLCTFLLLLAFPQAFLNSVGWGCSVVVFSAITTNMTITPAMLLSFECFLGFELFPWKDMIALYNKIPKKQISKRSISVEECVQQLPDTGEGRANDDDVSKDDSSKEDEQHADHDPGVLKTPQEAKHQYIKGDTQRGIWYRLAFVTTKYYWLVLLVAFGITIPFLLQFLRINPTSDDNLIYLQGSDSLKALHRMKKAFNEGSLDPYNVIVRTGKPNSIISKEYFQFENYIVHQILLHENKYLNEKSIRCLSYFYEQDVSYEKYLDFTSVNSSLYNTDLANSYRQLVLNQRNFDKSTSLIRIETTVPPNAQVDVYFIRSTRDLLDRLSAESQSTSLPVSLYLFGAYTTTMDVQDTLFRLLPIMICVTIAIALIIVGISFGSIGLALRLAITSFMSLSWTYGLLVLVYQPGPFQDAFAHVTPSLRESTGLYWIVPIMSFSILVGLSLDYDIFVMSRVVEFRRMGWSDRAAVCLAIEKTGGIITAAGLIMSISFAGLLIPKTIVLNQYGFSLFVGVAIDTFVVRTFFVPAVVAAFGRFPYAPLNWYPVKMPPVLLSEEDEGKALRSGLWSPKLFAKSVHSQSEV